MKSTVVIPARMAASRFPGKPLKPLLGRPMIEHVYRRASLWRGPEHVYVATCDEAIRLAVESFGGRVIMTSDRHERASDRVAEAARGLETDVVVLVQGDEPMITPASIGAAVAPFATDPSVECVNLARRIETEAEYRDPNTIKVAMDRRGDALYFSREPIPTTRVSPFGRIPTYKQVCVIPFRKDVLLRYAELEPTPLEKAESVDMLRLLEHGYRVRMVETDLDTYAVDTPDDLHRVEERMRADPLTTVALGAWTEAST